LTVIVVSGLAWSFTRWYEERPFTRTLRVGFQDSPPYHFPDEKRGPSGPVVAVIQEAARRAAIQLEWRYSPQGPESALNSGSTDLWPIVGDLPERRQMLYVSAPWVKMTYVLFAPEDLHLKGPRDLEGRSLAVAKISLDSRVAARYADSATILQLPTTADVMSAVCSGRAAAGLLAHSAFAGGRIGDCPRAPLRALPVSDATYWFGVGANRADPEARRAADVLHQKIGEMANDGTLITIDFRWQTSLSTEASTIFQYDSARARETMFIPRSRF
jgi:ABC-type amino acid transport substrate-binding protein